MQRRGTTMIELVIAMGVIITGLITVVGLIARSITVGTLAKNKLIAVTLAQEGVEAVRSIRDANILARQSDVPGFAFTTGFFEIESAGGDGLPRRDFTGVPVYDFNTSGAGLLDTPWSIDFRADDFGIGFNSIVGSNQEMTDPWTVVYRHTATGLFYQGDKRQSEDTETGFKRYIMVEPIYDNYAGCLLCRHTQTSIYIDDTELDPNPKTLSNARVLAGFPDTPATIIGFRVVAKVQWKEERRQENIVITQNLYDWHD